MASNDKAITLEEAFKRVKADNPNASDDDIRTAIAGDAARKEQAELPEISYGEAFRRVKADNPSATDFEIHTALARNAGDSYGLGSFVDKERYADDTPKLTPQQVIDRQEWLDQTEEAQGKRGFWPAVKNTLAAVPDSVGKMVAGNITAAAGYDSSLRVQGQPTPSEMMMFGDLPLDQQRALLDDAAKEKNLSKEEFQALKQKDWEHAQQLANDMKAASASATGHDDQRYTYDRAANYGNLAWDKLKKGELWDATKASGNMLAEASKFGIDTTAGSAANMMGATALPTMMQFAGQGFENRSKNNGGRAPELKDAAYATVEGVVDQTLERVFPKLLGEKVAKGLTEAEKAAIKANAVKYVAKTASIAGLEGFLVEGGTEALQNGLVEYLAERLGTDNEGKMSVADAVNQAWQGFVGGGFGGMHADAAVSGAKAAYDAKKVIGGTYKDPIQGGAAPQQEPNNTGQAQQTADSMNEHEREFMAESGADAMQQEQAQPQATAGAQESTEAQQNQEPEPIAGEPPSNPQAEHDGQKFYTDSEGNVRPLSNNQFNEPAEDPRIAELLKQHASDLESDFKRIDGKQWSEQTKQLAKLRAELDRKKQLTAKIGEIGGSSVSAAEFSETPEPAQPAQSSRMNASPEAIESELGQGKTVDEELADIEGSIATEKLMQPVKADTVLPEGAQDVSQNPQTIEAQQPEQTSAVNPSRKNMLILPNGKKLNAEWDAVEADSVTASMKEGTSQPRDRQRAASNSQVDSISQNPDWDRLSDTSKLMSDGAPTLTKNGEIVGGNGRYEGLHRAYEGGKAENYRQNLLANAERLGLDPNAIGSMKAPILVRRVTDDADTRELAISSNERTGLEMSPMEKAALDAERMGEHLDSIEFDDNGRVMKSQKNLSVVDRAFGFMSPEEKAGLLDKDGQLSSMAESRVKNAVILNAYGKGEATQRLLESIDPDLVNLGNGLAKAAADYSGMKRQAAANPRLNELDISQDIDDSIKVLSRLKQGGHSVEEYLGQKDAFGGELSEEGRKLLSFFGENLRKPNKIASALRHYADIAQRSTEEGLFGFTPITKQEALDGAKIYGTNEPSESSPEPSLFAENAATKRGDSESGGRGSSGEHAGGFEQPADKPAGDAQNQVKGEKAPEPDEGFFVPHGVDPLSLIPPSYLKRLVDVKVHTEGKDGSTSVTTEKVPAKEALASLDEDIRNFESLLNCVRGG